MALKAIHYSDIPNQNFFHDIASVSMRSPRFSNSLEVGKAAMTTIKSSEFLVIGHRGNGMNMLHLSDSKMNSIKENTILSFNAAGKYSVDYIEFDVQVTKDGHPIIFHDDFIISEEDNGTIHNKKRVTELSLSEFLKYGPQKEPSVLGKTLFRKTKNGEIVKWGVQSDDPSCTLQEAFQKVQPSLGFNIELKFNDYRGYGEDELTLLLKAVLKVVHDHADKRPIIFSTFQPDAAKLLKKLQSKYPVYFLTDGGIEMYDDKRRNSLEEAIKLCLEGRLDGIVCEVCSILRNPWAANKIKESELTLLTYGKLNNVVEVVYLEHLMGIDGVIVDLVEEITDGVRKMVKPEIDEEMERVEFSQGHLEFLLKLIPELIYQQQ